MSNDKEKNGDNKVAEKASAQFPPPPSPPATMFNFPSGSSASPMSGQAAFLGPALSQLQSLSFQKEPNPEIVKIQYEAVMHVSDNLKDENIRQIEYQESHEVKQHDIISKREGREFATTLIALGTVITITGVGVYMLAIGESVAGAGLISGGLGTILGFLGGMGVSKKLQP